MKETITIEGVGPDTLAIALKAVMGNGTEPTIQNAVKAIAAGKKLPTEQQQRTKDRGMSLQQAVSKLMSSENGAYQTTLDGRQLVAKKAEETPIARKSGAGWSYAKKMYKVSEDE